MWPGTLVAKATSPGYCKARYSVMKMVPPAMARLKTPNRPPPPPIWVWVVIWMDCVIHDSSPLSENTLSLGSSCTSSTGIVVPWIRVCMKPPQDPVDKHAPGYSVWLQTVYTGPGQSEGTSALRRSRICTLRELLQVEAQLVGLALRQQVFPGDLALLIRRHAAQHATERGLHPRRNLIVRGPRSDAVDEASVLVAIGKFEIVEKSSVGGELALARNIRCRLRPLPCLRS